MVMEMGSGGLVKRDGDRDGFAGDWRWVTGDGVERILEFAGDRGSGMGKKRECRV